MIQAAAARFRGFSPGRGRGRWTLHFQADGVDFPVHVVYHNAPDLPPALWALCLQELALACLVDVTTATLARSVSIEGFHPGTPGLDLFRQATRALRAEVLYDWWHSLGRLPMEVRTGGLPTPCPPLPAPSQGRVLLLMGGGKDSLYAYRLLTNAGYDVECFYLTEVRRTWQQLRRVEGALAGRTVQHRAFLDVGRRGVLTEAFGGWYRSQFQIGQAIAAALPYALSRGCGRLALGLELTSDLPMATYRGVPINHQHQKSTPFVRCVNRHLAHRFGGALAVTSPVKGLYDLGIYARFLAQAPDLVPLQSSCGGANTHRPHCGRCDKCAFLSALLAGLSGDPELYRKLFPTDPLSRPELFAAWLDDAKVRPLTCAGLKDEVRVGLELARSKGWRLDWHEASGSRMGPGRLAGELQRFLGAHPNPLVGPEMGQRLAPHLRALGATVAPAADSTAALELVG